VRQLAKSYPRKGLGHLLRDTNRVNTGLRLDVATSVRVFGKTFRSLLRD